MGSIAAMNSIDRVLEKHGEDIRLDYESRVPESVKHLFDRVELENNLYGIAVTWVFRDGSMLPGPEIDIDALASDYPDSEVSY